VRSVQLLVSSQLTLKAPLLLVLASEAKLLARRPGPRKRRRMDERAVLLKRSLMNSMTKVT
jgi:hypothetical protein